MADFNTIMKRRGQGLNKLKKNMEDKGRAGFRRDPRLWKPQADKTQKTFCIVRLLGPSYLDAIRSEIFDYYEKGLDAETIAMQMKDTNGDIVTGPMFVQEILDKFKAGHWQKIDFETPIAEVVRNNFKGPGGYYNEISPKTYGLPCPVTEMDRAAWEEAKDTNDEAAKAILRKRTGHSKFFCNAYIIKDETNPENEGQVKIFEFGKKIYEKIMKAESPRHGEAFDPFDPFDGADFELDFEYESRTFNGNEVMVPSDWGGCRYAANTAFMKGDEEAIVDIWKKSHAISDFYDRSKVKDYEVLQAKLYKVLGTSAPSASQPAEPSTMESDALSTPTPRSTPAPQPETQPEPKAEPKAEPQQPAEQKTEAPSGNDINALLAKLNKK